MTRLLAKDCGGPTSKRSYKRCQACNFKTTGRQAERNSFTFTEITEEQA